VAGDRFSAPVGRFRGGVLVVYYRAPLDRPLDPETWIEFTIGLPAFGAVLAWQVRAILESGMPRLRAIRAVAVGLPLLLLLFTSTYVLIARNAPQSFTEELSRTDTLCFTVTVTVTVFATVGSATPYREPRSRGSSP
jgi:voltage-gated potassium channel